MASEWSPASQAEAHEQPFPPLLGDFTVSPGAWHLSADGFLHHSRGQISSKSCLSGISAIPFIQRLKPHPLKWGPYLSPVWAVGFLDAISVLGIVADPHICYSSLFLLILKNKITVTPTFCLLFFILH